MRIHGRHLIAGGVAVSKTVATLGYAVGRAQVKPEPIPHVVLTDNDVVLTGKDIGFRMVGRKGQQAVGVLVVKVGDEWVSTVTPWDVLPSKGQGR